MFSSKFNHLRELITAYRSSSKIPECRFVPNFLRRVVSFCGKITGRICRAWRWPLRAGVRPIARATIRGRCYVVYFL